MFDAYDITQEVELDRLQGATNPSRTVAKLRLLQRYRKRAKAKQVPLPQRDWNTRATAGGGTPLEVLLDGLPSWTLAVAQSLSAGSTREEVMAEVGISRRAYDEAVETLRGQFASA
jgi:hypothetical protein